MKKILFPTDFSEAAENAFLYALRVADKSGAEIVTFHSYRQPDLSRSPLPNTVSEVYDSINLEEFENYRDNVPRLNEIAEEQGLTKVKVSHVLEDGDTIASILRFAKKENPDLIIMGTTGASGLKEVFIGSVAGEIMENAPCPVLAVPIEAKFDGRMNRIGFTTEFKSEEKAALEYLNNWSRPFFADIHCIHVDINNVESLSHRMDNLKADFLDKRNIQFEVLEGENLEHTIADYLFENKIDLLAMVIHKRTFFQELFSYSQTKKMAYHFSVPILALQANLFSEGKVKISFPTLNVA